jgi:hypothetical protein
MNHKLLFFLILALAKPVFSQDYMNEIAIKSCECLNTISDTLDTERFNLELGLCMIEAAAPFKKRLKKDYRIDFNKIDEHGADLGRIIGLRMASVCPDAVVKLAHRTNDEEAALLAENLFEGQIVAIDATRFVEFSIKDAQGKISKFYWFTFIESGMELTNNYQNLMEQSVQITYSIQELFDARIQEYRNFNVIQKLELKD